MISVNNLKTDSENDNENAGIPSFPLPKPTTSYVNDLDFFKDFENKFPAIFYNEAQTSKSDLLTEPILSPQHIDEFNLNDETSVSEYDEEEQNILYFNDLFPFNIIRPDNLKSEKDNNDNDIDMIQSSEDMAPLPPREQRHTFLRYQGLEYTNEDIADFEERMVMEHRNDAGVVVFTSQARGRLFDTRRPQVRDLTLEFLCTLRFGEVLLDLDALGGLLLEKSGAHIYGRQFVARLAKHFGLLTVEILGGLTVIAPKLPIINMGELVRLQICMKVNDTWDWVSMGPEKQPDAAAGALRVAKDAPAVDEDDQAVSESETWGLSLWHEAMLTKLMVLVGEYPQAFDGDFRGTHCVFQRRTRQRTGEASTSAAQQDPLQPDP
ncbi:hypothetical protein Tco_1081756 [Tanacetum coccineum]|uniref:Uncharacterized protein n=1 Tax=Tanacetum coccineum TaxID=301880 RepID=A0ABQ5HYC8_9ASTR